MEEGRREGGSAAKVNSELAAPLDLEVVASVVASDAN